MTRNRAHTRKRLNAVSHHSSLATPAALSLSGSKMWPWFGSNSGFMAYSRFQCNADGGADQSNQGDPAHDAGVAAEHVHCAIAQAQEVEAHQPPTVTPTAVFAAGRERIFAIEMMAVGQHPKAVMAGAGGPDQAEEQE